MENLNKITIKAEFMRYLIKGEDKKEKSPSSNINCDTGILEKLYSNLWKYWIFNVEIFTYFDYNMIMEKNEKWIENKFIINYMGRIMNLLL